MDFKTKNRIVKELADQQFIDKDRSLLESSRPGHELLSRSSVSRRNTLDDEMLYVLLDSFSAEQIINHRHGVKCPAGDIPFVPGVSIGSAPTEALKKKFKKKMNTLVSIGLDWKTKMSKKLSSFTTTE